MFNDKHSAVDPVAQQGYGGETQQESPYGPTYAVWAVVFITLLAFFLRVHQLQLTPPGFNYDEAAHALDALDVLQGQHSVWSGRSGGNPMLFMYLIAGSFGMLGARPFAQRLLVAFLSTATIPAVYLLARTMFQELGKHRAQFTGVLAALGLATSFWHLNHSRMGLEFNPAPFFEVLSFYFLWRGLRTRAWWSFLISGFWLGLALYVYPTARFVPVLLALFFIYLWLRENALERRERTSGHSVKQSGGVSFRRTFLPLVLVATGTLLIFSPVGIHFVMNPSDFVGRAGDTFFMNPVVSQGEPWSRLLRGAIANIGAFGFTVDENALANVAGRSLLDPVMAILFWAGLLWCLYRIKKPPYTFCVLWWGVLLIPVFLTPDRFPHFGRLVSTAPVVYMLIALALEQLWYGLGRLAGDKRSLQRAVHIALLAAMVVIYGTAGVSAYQDYFVRWANNRQTFEDFYGPTVELAELMNADTGNATAYVLPCNTREPACDYYTLDFCLDDNVTYRAIRMNEWEAAEKLTEAAQGKDSIKLIRLKIGKRKFRLDEGDPKGILDFLLERQGFAEAEESYPAYDIIHYRLPSPQTDFTTAPDARAKDARFGSHLLLRDAAFGDASGSGADVSARQGGNREPVVPAGGTLWAVLNWKALGTIPDKYKTSMRLRDEAGHLVAQLDHILQDNWQNRTNRWKPEDDPVPDYYLFPVPHTTPPGKYTLEVVVYSEDTLQSLPAGGGPGRSSVALGEIQVSPAGGTSGGLELDMVSEIGASIIAGTIVRGSDMDTSRPYSPGEKGTLAVYWQVEKTPDRDLNWSLELAGESGTWPLTDPAPPLGSAYPTSQWAAGQSWRGIYDLKIPAEVPEGRYSIVGTFTDNQARTVGEPVTFGSIDIAGRARVFDAPEIANPVGADFGGKIRLLGYDLETNSLKRGSDMDFLLHWQALAPMDTSYTTFVQLLDRNGVPRAQRDTVPGNGTLPTTGWLPGEVVSDRVAVPLAEDLATGQYAPIVGVYDAATGERLPVYGQDGQSLGDHTTLPNVAVE